MELELPTIDIDAILKSDAFRETITQADCIAAGTGRGDWPVRVGLVCLKHGPMVCRRYVSRRKNYKDSEGWVAYQRLCLEGVVHGGYLWWSDDLHGDTEWYNDPHAWMFAMMDIAAGGEVPETFPVYIPEDPAQVQVAAT